MRKGFTLIETVIATSLTTIVVVAAVGSWLLFLQKSNRASNQAILDMDARRVVETFRHEVRNAARETIMFYPENSEPYQALGFALARDDDQDGLMDMDAQGSNILWRETVIYHVWNSSDPPEMRRTVFSNRNNDSSRDEYYRQLTSVAKNGTGASARLAGETAKTDVMFSNLFTGQLWHAEATFDGYNATPNKREKITFGSLALGPGAHTMDLTITGKNPSSSGRALRIDQLGLGVCGWMLETESCSLGGASSASLYIGPSAAGAAYSVFANTGSDGDKLSVTLYNDAIEEAEFIGAGRKISQSNTVVRFDQDYCPANCPNGSYVTMLDGHFAVSWEASLNCKLNRTLSYEALR